jgi:hypothetical protein
MEWLVPAVAVVAVLAAAGALAFYAWKSSKQVDEDADGLPAVKRLPKFQPITYVPRGKLRRPVSRRREAGYDLTVHKADRVR